MLKGLHEREDDLQRTLGTSSVLEATTSTDLITWQKVQSRIPADTVLVELLQYQPFDVHYKALKDSLGPPRYAAYVLRGTGDPVVVQLGDVATIDAQIGELRRAMSDPRRTDTEKLSRALYDRVLDEFGDTSRRSRPASYGNSARGIGEHPRY